MNTYNDPNKETIYAFEEYVYIRHYLEDTYICNKEENIKLMEVEKYIFEKIMYKKKRYEIIEELSDEFNDSSGEIITECLNKFLSKYSKFLSYTSNKPMPPITQKGILGACIPRTISIELTNKCSHNCIHCMNDASISCDEKLNTSDLLRFIDKIANHVDELQLTGGDPMEHPDFEKILLFCKNKSLNILISTTGIRINSSNVKLFKGCEVSLSIYSHDSKLHNDVTQLNNSFELTLRAADLLIANGVDVHMSSILKSDNIKKINKLVTLANQRKFKSIRFGEYAPTGRGLRNNLQWKLTKKEENEAFNRTYDLNQILKKEIDVYVFPKADLKLIKNLSSCSAGKSLWILKPCGDLIPCYYLPKDIFSFANIYEHSWDELIYRFSREQFEEKIRAWRIIVESNGNKLRDICEYLE